MKIDTDLITPSGIHVYDSREDPATINRQSLLRRILFPSFQHKPPLAGEVLHSFLQVALFGCLTGPVISFGIDLLGGTLPLSFQAGALRWILASALLGAFFAITFYTTCALPMIYLSARLDDYPIVVARTLRMLIGATGGSVGCVAVFYTTSRFLSWDVFPRRWLIPILVIDVFSAATLTLVIGAFTRLRDRVERSARVIHEQQLREHLLAEQTARAQSRALQAQINPHFLFNTLNTVSALVETDPASARAMIAQLAEMYRYTFSCSRIDLVSLSQELALVENYIRLEKARLRDRLDVEIKIDGDIAPVQVPCLLLQPIVENAIKHGVAKRRGGGKLLVELSHDGGFFRASVLNQFAADDGWLDLSAKNIFRDGHALANVRERLRLFYGEAHGLKIELESNEWVRVSLWFPANPRQA